MRLALVHDWLNQLGGAEDVLRRLVSMFPGAPVYTSIYWRDGLPADYRTWDIRTTWMDRLPQVYRWYQRYFALYPLTFARLDLSEYDVVLSNKSGFCHGVHTGNALHICYCLTPTRYVWDFEAYAAREAVSSAAKMAVRPLLPLLRRWDYRAAQRVTRFVAISREVQDRIRRIYRRESVIIPPPVDTAVFRQAAQAGQRYDGLPEGYYLIVSRLVPYRRIDLAVQAFNHLGLPLVIAGEGRDRPRLEALAGATVKFLGRVPDEDLAGLFAGCYAYILPGVEDFGIAPLQAQAAGRPVIACGAGGALDTVMAGETGAFFAEATPEALAQAVRSFRANEIDPRACQANAERFSAGVFEERLRRFIVEASPETAAVGAGGAAVEGH
ncbi:MAG: glycosyltransferase family 4 protein [Anaerolineales bacterium]|nr:glycosyltransferase family 4 protein [Anaerolineales bacterium]